jgi:hypothetical protein
MGYSAQRGNIRLLLSALEDILEDLGHPVERGAATDAAQQVYEAYETVATPQYSGNNGMGETIAAEEVAQGVAHKN